MTTPPANENTLNTGSPADDQPAGTSASPRHIPSLLVKTGMGRPLSKYIAPGSTTNPSPHFMLPDAATIIEDLKTCNGDLTLFLEAASRDAKLHPILLFDVFQQVKQGSMEFVFNEVIHDALTVRRLRLGNIAMDALEKNLTGKNPSANLLVAFLRGNTTGGAGKSPPPGSVANPFNAYLDLVGGTE